MTLSARMDDIEEAMNKFTATQEMLYNMVFGMAVKIDMLQAIIMQILDKLDSEIKDKVMNISNLQKLADTVTSVVQERLDTMAFGDKERADSAPLDQMIEDSARANDR